MSAPSLAQAVAKRGWLSKMLKPVSNWYINAAGYRQMGLRTDDLISEEDENVLAALNRLPPKEAYDRIYRIRRATQLSLTHKLLPKNEWTTQEEDVPYLRPLIEQIEAEAAEKAALDTLTIVKN
ncbi:cytochrome b-c1 complex subunit 7 [Neurospora tetraspora]|uniref:Cytochrome b-c1 complex subunit 7 n=1 Tax=Neurospora tetraspora TaxID=94610 RepID=A0AAE0IZM3_9PEZI|nr:cytochrome b-c1 complex subunit 7 [Neurospora tetraspora]KAK3351987.1 cytochrome b-c1 complex subunit 7 [Neurospora tetraspora]